MKLCYHLPLHKAAVNSDVVVHSTRDIGEVRAPNDRRELLGLLVAGVRITFIQSEHSHLLRYARIS
jgi:hypothetical protein